VARGGSTISANLGATGILFPLTISFGRKAAMLTDGADPRSPDGDSPLRLLPRFTDTAGEG
jgi:hypothetical protein